MWKKADKSIYVSVGLVFVLILSILLHYSMNRAQAEPVTTPQPAAVNPQVEVPALEEIKPEAEPLAENLDSRTIMEEAQVTTESLPVKEVVVEVVESDGEPTLKEVREHLSQRAAEIFLKPGWVHIQKSHRNLINPNAITIIPENGQIISSTWDQEDWILIDDKLNIAATYTSVTLTDGTSIYFSIMSNGAIFPESNPFFLKTVSLDALLDIEYLFELSTQSNKSNLKIEFDNSDDPQIVTITTIEKFSEPMSMEGMDQFVNEVLTNTRYNWNNGTTLGLETWNLIDNGEKIQANFREVSVEFTEQAPDHILESFNNSF